MMDILNTLLFRLTWVYLYNGLNTAVVCALQTVVLCEIWNVNQQ